MSVYDYAEHPELYGHNFYSMPSIPKQGNKANAQNQENEPTAVLDHDALANARFARRNEAKLSVEFDYNSIVRNEVDKVQQFKDTIKLLEDHRLMQSLAHQIHLCFRAYVKSDIKGYVSNFGANEVTKEHVTLMLKVFAGHMMTILGKLVEGMSATYLKSLFQKQSNDGQKKDTPLEEFEKLANQWSMHQLSPRTLNMSITSIQSAISKEIM